MAQTTDTPATVSQQDATGRNITAQYVTWLSSAGYKQSRWDVYRGTFLLGSISKCDIVAGWSQSGKYQALLNHSYSHKYLTTLNFAMRWVAQQMINTYPISELANRLNNTDW